VGTTPPPAGATNPPVTGAANPPVTGAANPPGGARPVGVVPVQPVTGAATPAAAAPPAQILLTAPTSELQLGGQPYTVPVSVTGVSDLAAVTLTIMYDPKIIKATSVSPGTFMQQGAVTPTFQPKIDEVNGRIDIAISRSGSAPGAAGTGLLAGLVFQGIAPGQSKITVTGTAYNPKGEAIAIQLPAGTTVTVK